MGGVFGTYGGLERRMTVLVGRPERKRPLDRYRRRWEDSIKIVIQEVGWERMDWFAVVQDRNRWRALVNAVRNLRVL
jgi:hypothetical protein